MQALYNGEILLDLESVSCPNYAGEVLLESDEFTMDYRPQTRSIALKSYIEWALVNYTDWILVSPLGGAQNAIINLSVSKNETKFARLVSVGFCYQKV